MYILPWNLKALILMFAQRGFWFRCGCFKFVLRKIKKKMSCLHGQGGGLQCRHFALSSFKEER